MASNVLADKSSIPEGQAAKQTRVCSMLPNCALKGNQFHTHVPIVDSIWHLGATTHGDSKSVTKGARKHAPSRRSSASVVLMWPDVNPVTTCFNVDGWMRPVPEFNSPVSHVEIHSG